MAKSGLYANIHAKKMRIAKGSNEKMHKRASKGAPTAASIQRQQQENAQAQAGARAAADQRAAAANFKRAAKTAKKK